jgi:hypothetical protein
MFHVERFVEAIGTPMYGRAQCLMSLSSVAVTLDAKQLVLRRGVGRALRF